MAQLGSIRHFSPALLLAASLAFGQTGIKEKKPVFGSVMTTAPEWRIWTEISQKFNLSFIGLPEDLLEKVARDGEQERGVIPAGLYRRIERHFSYNVHTVWNGYEVPLHPGAARYYQEKGYMK